MARVGKKEVRRNLWEWPRRLPVADSLSRAALTSKKAMNPTSIVSMLRNLRVPALAIAAEIVHEAVVVVPAAVEAAVDVVVVADATEGAEAVVATVVADAADLVVAAGVAT